MPLVHPTPLAFRKYSRMAESQADELGLQYLYRTGYDPVAFVDFFERMARKEDNPGRFAQRSVTLGPQQDNVVAITGGLKEGEPVVTEGSLFLRFVYTSK